MKKILLTTLTFILFVTTAYEQEIGADTSPVSTLAEVIVKGYEQDRPLQQVGGAVSIIDQKQLQRTSGISVLPALNATPGIRMEERSPGSYRLNIRGSSLRSPFGVRNVKIYLNEIPFTDPGGTSYLNQFSIFNFSSLEVLKGPGSSLYGAGTGGVILITPLADTLQNGLSLHYARGSFDTKLLHVAAVMGDENYKHTVSYTRQNSDGYRNQSAMDREVMSWQSRLRSGERQTLSTHVFYGDLYYQTPGALTLAQYRNNPKAARPAAGAFPSAQQARATIYQKTFWAGVNHQFQLSESLQHSASVYGAISNVRNPTIRNYERRTEPHFGGRTSLNFSTTLGNTSMKLIAGTEFQQGDFNIRVFRNNNGNPDSLQTDDEVHNRQLGIFAQAEFGFYGGWILTAGASFNNTKLQFIRLSQVPNFQYNSRFDNELAPRIALLKTISSRISVYGVVSKGYSPPTVAEVLPSTSIINTSLQAEEGINYEVGARGNFLGTRLYVDINAFYFALNKAITQMRDASGADFFINAGGTKQKGLETYLNYQLLSNRTRLMSGLSFYLSHTYHHFRYSDYKPLNTDYTGKQLPGVSPHTIAAGVDAESNAGIYAHLNYFYSDRIAMNDANAEFAPDYHLLGGKLGFRKKFGGHMQGEVFVAADNLLNENYSLGNDINALGNRFYNAAAGVNYQAGIVLRYAMRDDR